MLADAGRATLHYQSSHAALGHFARFMQPGARRVLCAATREALECTAALNPDGSVVVVVQNRGEEPLRFLLQGAGLNSAVLLPARSIVTLVRPG